jgi:hypothetical protein
MFAILAATFDLLLACSFLSRAPLSLVCTDRHAGQSGAGNQQPTGIADC